MARLAVMRTRCISSLSEGATVKDETRCPACVVRPKESPSGNLAATDRELSKLKELRAMLEKANQSYWAEQVEIQMLAASAWIAHAKGQEDEALKFARRRRCGG